MDQTHLTSLTELLLQRGLHIATAESCTLGGVASALGSHSGASAYLQGGIIAYQSDLKTSLLGVPPELIETYHVVSEEVACAMALGAMEQLQAEVAIATLSSSKGQEDPSSIRLPYTYRGAVRRTSPKRSKRPCTSLYSSSKLIPNDNPATYRPLS